MTCDGIFQKYALLTSVVERQQYIFKRRKHMLTPDRVFIQEYMNIGCQKTTLHFRQVGTHGT